MNIKKIIFVGCDGRYFDLYAETLVASLNLNSPGQSIFFSICNPSKDFVERFNSIQRRALATSMSYETYLSDISVKEHIEKKAYYANHRFVRLSQFFNQQKSHVLFLDIDSIVINDLLFSNLLFSESDVGIQLRLDNKRKRVRVLAAGIFIQYNQHTVAFLKELALRLQDNYKWFDDQIFLYTLLRKNKNLRVSDFNCQYLDYDFSDEALIWSGKGDRKFLNEKYTNYTAYILEQFRLPEKTDTLYFPSLSTDLDEEDAQVAMYLSAKKINLEHNQAFAMRLLSDAVQYEHTSGVVYSPANVAAVQSNTVVYGENLTQLNGDALNQVIVQLSQESGVVKPALAEPVVNLRKPYYLLKGLKKMRYSIYRLIGLTP